MSSCLERCLLRLNCRIMNLNQKCAGFLHTDIQAHCLQLYNGGNYRDCAVKAFSIVLSAYKEKFNVEGIPKHFSKTCYISGASGARGGDEDKSFQSACEHVFRCIKKFRNEKMHTDPKVKISESEAAHYLFLCSMALGFLDRLETYTNSMHPFVRDDYKSEKMSGPHLF